MRIPKVVEPGEAGPDLAEDFAEFVMGERFGCRVIPKSQQHAFNPPVAALAFARQAFAKSREAAADEGHPELLEASLAAEAEIRGAAGLRDEGGQAIGLGIALGGKIPADVFEQPGLGDAGGVAVGGDRIKGAGEGSLKRDGRRLGGQAKLVHPFGFAGVMPESGARIGTLMFQGPAFVREV